MKRCKRCKEEKTLDSFTKNKNGYYQSRCKSCRNEDVKKYNKENKEKVNSAALAYYYRHLGECRQKSLQRYKEKNSEIREKQKIYQRSSQVRKIRAKTLKNRLRNGISASIGRGLKKGKEGKSWTELLEFNLNSLMVHMEKQFTRGMSWGNYGEWHIDHIIPVSVFNFSSPKHLDFKRCWQLSNLRPLWAKENLAKGMKLREPFQPSLAL